MKRGVGGGGGLIDWMCIGGIYGWNYGEYIVMIKGKCYICLKSDNLAFLLLNVCLHGKKLIKLYVCTLSVLTCMIMIAMNYLTKVNIGIQDIMTIVWSYNACDPFLQSSLE